MKNIFKKKYYYYNNMLALDYSKNLYHKYHLTNKLLLPSLILNYGIYKYNPNYSEYFTAINAGLLVFIQPIQHQLL